MSPPLRQARTPLSLTRHSTPEMPALGVRRVGGCRSKRCQAEATCGPWSPSQQHVPVSSASPAPKPRHTPCATTWTGTILPAVRKSPSDCTRQTAASKTSIYLLQPGRGRTHLLFMENLDSFLLFCLWPLAPHPSNQTCYPGNKLDRPKILMTNGTEGKKKICVYSLPQKTSNKPKAGRMDRQELGK